MALTRTALQLATDVRDRADHIVGTFRTNVKLYRYLSESARGLVSMLVDEYDEMYWANEATITTVDGAKTSDLPADAWKAIMLRVTLGGQRKKITKASIDEIDTEASSTGGWANGRWPRMRMMGRRIYWAPIPRAAHDVTLYYVPTTIFCSAVGTPISELTADTDYFDGVFGWEQLVVLDAAMKLLSDEKKDTATLQQEWADRWAEVAAAAANQTATEAARVRDNYRGGSDDDDYYREVFE